MAATDMQGVSSSDKPIGIPNNNDVLCGRGGNINSHPGNEHFRNMVEKHRRVYLNARFKEEKRLIATTIVDEIRALDPPGRFLTKDLDSGTWCDIGDNKARDKTSQALRENAPSIRAGLNGEKRPKPKRKKKTTKPPAPPSYMQQQQQQWNGPYPPAPGYFIAPQGPIPTQPQPPGVVSSHPFAPHPGAPQNAHPHLVNGAAPQQQQHPNMVWSAQAPQVVPGMTPVPAQRTDNSQTNATTGQATNAEALPDHTPSDPFIPAAPSSLSGERGRKKEKGNFSFSPIRGNKSQEETQVMDIEGEGNNTSSLLNMVATHILGAWDMDMVCGTDDDVLRNGKQDYKRQSYTPSTGGEMPPPKERRNDNPDVSSRAWAAVEPKHSFASLADDSMVSPAASMEMDTCPKEWRGGSAEMDGQSIGSFSSGLMSMNDNVLNQVPSWEGSIMSAASGKPRDSFSISGAPSRPNPQEESEASFDTNMMSQDYVDTRMAIALQQQENTAAYEAFKRRMNSTAKAGDNRTARSGALDHLKAVRDKDPLDHRMQSSTFDQQQSSYVPPIDQTSLPQEIADHQLAMELQRFEQARVGTVQQMEKLLKQEQSSGEDFSRQRTGRSVYKF